jgi:hypothetical protein
MPRIQNTLIDPALPCCSFGGLNWNSSSSLFTMFPEKWVHFNGWKGKDSWTQAVNWVKWAILNCSCSLPWCIWSSHSSTGLGAAQRTWNNCVSLQALITKKHPSVEWSIHLQTQIWFIMSNIISRVSCIQCVLQTANQTWAIHLLVMQVVKSRDSIFVNLVLLLNVNSNNCTYK